MKNLTINLKLVNGTWLMNKLDYCYFNRRYEDCDHVIGSFISLLRNIRRDVVKEKNDQGRSPVEED